MRIKNGGSTKIPAFGIVRVTGITLLKGHPHVTVDQPDVYGGRAGKYLVNGPYPLAAGKYGEAQDGPLYSVYFDASDSATPAVGEEWGPVSGDWKARKNVPGFRVIGLPTAGDKIVVCTLSPVVSLLVKTDAAHAKGASGTCSVWHGNTPGSETDSTHNVTAWNRFADLETGKWGRVVPAGDDDWELIELPVEAPEVKIGKPDANINKGASGTVSVWSGEPGSETDTGDDVTGYAKARAVTSGKFVSLTRMPGNTGWYVDCWED